MEFRHTPQSNVAPFLARQIADQLQKGRVVLWLLSGGSGVQVCNETAKLLADSDLSGLYVTISDERYGTVGHTDENMQQLLDAGLSLPGATVYRPLTGSSTTKTTRDFDAWLTLAAKKADYCIALLGIGEDGHTSGIKPHSIAVNSQAAACYYTGEDYQRITTTASFLSRFDEAVVQAYGKTKRTVVAKLLQDAESSIDDFPAGLIRNIPQVTIFSDSNKEEVT